jgi:hypothetical protein
MLGSNYQDGCLSTRFYRGAVPLENVLQGVAAEGMNMKK